MNPLGQVRGELRMRQSPSIVPADRLNRDIYPVLEDFHQGPAWRETDEPANLQLSSTICVPARTTSRCALRNLTDR
jgi:hypothetical protein